MFKSVIRNKYVDVTGKEVHYFHFRDSGTNYYLIGILNRYTSMVI